MMLNAVEQRFTMLMVIAIWIHITRDMIWFTFFGLITALLWSAWTIYAPDPWTMKPRRNAELAQAQGTKEPDR